MVKVFHKINCFLGNAMIHLRKNIEGPTLKIINYYRVMK